MNCDLPSDTARDPCTCISSFSEDKQPNCSHLHCFPEQIDISWIGNTIRLKSHCLYSKLKNCPDRKPSTCFANFSPSFSWHLSQELGSGKTVHHMCLCNQATFHCKSLKLFCATFLGCCNLFPRCTFGNFEMFRCSDIFILRNNLVQAKDLVQVHLWQLGLYSRLRRAWTNLG